MSKNKYFLFLFFCCVELVLCSYKKPSPIPLVKLSPVAAAEMKGQPHFWLEVQVPQRRIVLAKGTQIVKTSAIAVGVPEYPSPTSSWRKISRVIWNPWWHPPKKSKWVEDPTPVPPRTKDNPLGEIKMPVGKDAYLIHGTSARHSIGTWASHGCIRMLFEDIFGLVQILFTEYADVSALDEMVKANKDKNTEFGTKLKGDIPVYFSYIPVKVIGDQLSLAPDLYDKLPNYMQEVRDVVRPHLVKGKKLDEKRVKEALKIAKHKTINVPLKQVIR